MGASKGSDLFNAVSYFLKVAGRKEGVVWAKANAASCPICKSKNTLRREDWNEKTYRRIPYPWIARHDGSWCQSTEGHQTENCWLGKMPGFLRSPSANLSKERTMLIKHIKSRSKESIIHVRIVSPANDYWFRRCAKTNNLTRRRNEIMHGIVRAYCEVAYEKALDVRRCCYKGTERSARRCGRALHRYWIKRMIAMGYR